jgi:hypothetical protein
MSRHHVDCEKLIRRKAFMAIEFTCSCGHTISVDESLAGQEVVCLGCSKTVTVPGTAGVMGYAAPAQGDPMVTPFAVDMIRQTTLWVRIMSVLMFIGVGFMLLASASMVVISLTAPMRGNAPTAILACVYIPMAVLYVIPAIFLWRYATHTKEFALTRHEPSLEAALQAQKSFWKFTAISALVLIGLYLLAIPIIIFVTVVSHRP